MSSITKPIILDESFNTAFAAVNENLKKIAVGVGGDYSKPTTWSEVRTLCRKGLVNKVMEVGDIMSVTIGSSSYDFAVMGFITNGASGSLKIRNENLTDGVIFQSVDCVNNLPFDSSEAFYAVEDSALATGTYTINFPTTSSAWTAGDYHFKLTKAVPVGGQLCLSGGNSTAITELTVDSYESTTGDLIESVAISSGSSGTSLGSLDGTTLNYFSRVSSGSNRWMTSNIRQFLNSDGEAGSFWTAQTKWDRPPAYLSSRAGFLNGLDSELLECITEMEIETSRNTITDGGGTDTTVDKIFFPEPMEVYSTQEGDAVGVAWDFYKNGSSHTSPSADTDAIRIKKYGSSTKVWYLRAPRTSLAQNARTATTTGALNHNASSSYEGIAPCFVIA